MLSFLCQFIYKSETDQSIAKNIRITIMRSVLYAINVKDIKIARYETDTCKLVSQRQNIWIRP